MSQLRIVLTNTSRSWGGNEYFAWQCARGLRARGHGVHFLWSHPVVGDRIRDAGIPATQIRLRVDADVAGFARIAQILLRERADAVVLTKWREYLLGGLAAKLNPRARCVFRMGLRVRPKDDLKRRLIFALADDIIVNAQEILDGFEHLPWLDRNKFRVVHNGLDLESFRPGRDGSTLRAEMGCADDELLLLAAGALTGQKGFDHLLRAMAELLRVSPRCRLAVAGDGPERSKLQALASELGIAGAVRFLGFRSDMARLLAAADVFVLSSVNEGMARVLIEALACGLPIVATEVSGSKACVEEGENGFLVPPREPQALADALRRMAESREARTRMGRRSRELAERRFDERRMLDELVTILEGSA